MTRYGKIARLPACIREELGERMERGEGGEGLLAWLNSLPQVKQVLQEEFGGVPISKQNLSEWRQGGYRDWRVHRDTMEQVRQLVSDSQDLEEFMDEKPLADHLATLVAVRYAAVLSNTKAKAEDRHQIRALRGLLRDIIDLRRSDHNAQRLKMERERWEFERMKLAEQAEKQARYRAEDRLLAPFNAAERAAQLTQAYGGSEAAQRVAARAAEVGYDLPVGFLSKDEPAASSGSECPSGRAPCGGSQVLAGCQESSKVKPSQSESKSARTKSKARKTKSKAVRGKSRSGQTKSKAGRPRQSRSSLSRRPRVKVLAGRQGLSRRPTGQSESRQVKPEGDREDGGDDVGFRVPGSEFRVGEQGSSKVEDGGEAETSNIERPTSNVDLGQSQSSLSGVDGRERAQRTEDENEDGGGIDRGEVLADGQVKVSHAESNQSQTLVKLCEDQGNSLTFSGLPQLSAEPGQTKSNHFVEVTTNKTNGGGGGA